MKVDIKTILAICGGIITLGGAITVIVKWLSPFKLRNIKRIAKEKEQDDRLTKHDKLLDTDNKRIASIEESNKLQLKSLMVMIEHQITGNSTEKLRTTKTEIQNFLINR